MFVDTVVNSVYQFMGERIDRLIAGAESWRDKYVVELVFGATARPALANRVAPDAAASLDIRGVIATGVWSSDS